MKPCPICAEPIQGSAIKCRYCGAAVSVADPMRPTPTVATGSSWTRALLGVMGAGGCAVIGGTLAITGVVGFVWWLGRRELAAEAAQANLEDAKRQWEAAAANEAATATAQAYADARQPGRGALAACDPIYENIVVETGTFACSYSYSPRGGGATKIERLLCTPTFCGPADPGAEASTNTSSKSTTRSGKPERNSLDEFASARDASNQYADVVWGAMHTAAQCIEGYSAGIICTYSWWTPDGVSGTETLSCDRTTLFCGPIGG